MKTVHKFPLHGVPGSSIVIKMPAGAQILHFAVQNRTPCIWALVDPANELEGRLFKVVGTGWPVSPDGQPTPRHRGTVQVEEASMGGDGQVFVWHLFEYVQ